MAMYLTKFSHTPQTCSRLLADPVAGRVDEAQVTACVLAVF
jgi:hypothetical protein